MGKKCVVLLSGGIDSTVLMYSLIADYEVHPLTINYGQRHKKEIMAARSVCEARGEWLLHRWKCVNLLALQCLLPSALTDASVEVPLGQYKEETMKQTVVPNRNMIFLAVAAGYAEGLGAEYVAYAAHASDAAIYPDCRPEFIESVGRTIKLATSGKVELIEPFTYKSKADIVELGRKLNVPLRLTWSCYKGEELHCGLCSTCLERIEAFKKAGVEDPTVYTRFGTLLQYKEFYNTERGLSEPLWGSELEDLQCTTCGSREMYESASPDDPEEIFPSETVRCAHCGRITDWYGALKQREIHPTEEVRGVLK